MGVYVGFDPGGAGAFGWAVVSGEGWPLRLVDFGVADHAQGALAAAMERAGSRVDGVGIDAPLFWTPAGDRHADWIVRRAITRLGCPGGTVQSVNSLRGGCLIQGILAAMISQQKAGSGIALTEAHPKALLWLLGKAHRERRPAAVGMVDLDDYVAGNRAYEAGDHERDAVLGAITAFSTNTRLQGWQDLYVLEPTPITPLNPPPAYCMPV